MAFLMLMLLAFTHARAQCPIVVDTLKATNTVNYSDTRNSATSGCSGTYAGFNAAGMIMYRITLMTRANLMFYNCGSLVNSKIMLYNSNFNLLGQDDGTKTEDVCTSHGFINTNLLPGTYYILSDNTSADGNITTQIYASPYTAGTIAGADMTNPIDIGTLVTGDTYTDFKDNDPGTGFSNVMGDLSNEIYYRFTLDRNEEVNITTTPSQQTMPTTVYLLDENGGMLASNTTTGIGSPYYAYNNGITYIDQVLPAGTYYMISESQLPYSGIVGTQIKLLTSYIRPSTAPPSILNTIKTDVITKPGVLTDTDLANLTYDQKQETIDYFDGLGKKIQEVQTKASPDYRDIVTPIIYDTYGRQNKSYLPYAETLDISDGSYKTTAIADQASFYSNPAGAVWNAPGVVTIPAVSGTVPSYGQLGYEPSPLNRTVEQGSPGATWQFSGSGNANSVYHTKKIVYTTNDQTSTFNSTVTTNNPGSRIVALYTTSVDSNTLSQRLIRVVNASYTQGQLAVTITKDENWKPGDGCIGTTEQYKNKSSQIVLKRNYNLNNGTVQMLSTYYVYDDFGRLAFVLPPGANPDASGVPVHIILDNLCYQYHYDSRNRLVEKKVPGKGWEYMIYNKLDEVIATQDSVQRMKIPQQAFYSKYDALGRVVISGYYKLTDSVAGVNNRASMQAAANAQTTLWETRTITGTGTGYTNATIPKTGYTILTTNYYDNTTGIPGLPANYSVGPVNASLLTSQLLTASKVSVINTPADVLWKVPYYDSQGRPIKIFKQHYLGGHNNFSVNNYDATTIGYNFINQPDTLTRYHFNTKNLATPAVKIEDTYIYDHAGRKIISTEQIASGSGQPITYFSKYDYNELGQLIASHFHSPVGMTNYLGEVSYSYNERGWQTAIMPLGAISDYGEKISYDKPLEAMLHHNITVTYLNSFITVHT